MPKDQNTGDENKTKKPLSDEQEKALIEAINELSKQDNTDEKVDDWNEKEALEVVNLMRIGLIDPEKMIAYVELLKAGVFTADHYQEIIKEAKTTLQQIDTEIHRQEEELEAMEVKLQEDKITLANLYGTAMEAVQSFIKYIGQKAMSAMEAVKITSEQEEIESIRSDLLKNKKNA